MTNLLLDSNIVIASVNNQRESLPARLLSALNDPENHLYVSVAALWEIVIKNRLGKLDLEVGIEKIPDFLRTSHIDILTLETRHALASVDPLPPTKDPFDRMLLAICAVEGMKLISIDRALTNHPLAY